MFVPVYEGPIAGFVKNYLRKHFWRVDRFREMDDVIQDSYELFLILKNRYQDKVDNPAWFMALYRVSFVNFITNMSYKNSRSHAEVYQGSLSLNLEDVEVIDFFSIMGDLENNGYSRVLLRQAPSEVKSVINLMLNCPTEMFEAVRDSFFSKKDHAGNEVLCKMLGKDPSKWNLISMVKNHFA